MSKPLLNSKAPVHLNRNVKWKKFLFKNMKTWRDRRSRFGLRHLSHATAVGEVSGVHCVDGVAVVPDAAEVTHSVCPKSANFVASAGSPSHQTVLAVKKFALDSGWHLLTWYSTSSLFARLPICWYAVHPCSVSFMFGSMGQPAYCLLLSQLKFTQAAIGCSLHRTSRFIEIYLSENPSRRAKNAVQ